MSESADGGLWLAAPAKVNLYLHVTGRRADGYHVLDSLVAFAGVSDALVLRPAADLSLAVDGPFAAAVPAGSGNLVLQAARRLAEAGGVRAGAAIGLTKRLPVGAGLGGGSADAAAALRGLSSLWGLGPADADLAEIAARLGADVPVCLAGRAAFVGGAGERLSPAPDLPPAWLVLVNPGPALATAAVFAERSGAFSEAARFAEAPADAAALALLLAGRRNDLGAPARALVPATGQVLAALAAAAGALLARLSGSGATCFALFAEAAAATKAARTLARRHAAWWVKAAPLEADTRRQGAPRDGGCG